MFYVKIYRWTPDDWIVIKSIKCKQEFNAKFLKVWFLLLGYDRVVVE